MGGTAYGKWQSFCANSGNRFATIPGMLRIALCDVTDRRVLTSPPTTVCNVRVLPFAEHTLLPRRQYEVRLTMGPIDVAFQRIASTIRPGGSRLWRMRSSGHNSE